MVFKERDAATIFAGENDSLANRPLIITAFPLGIQYLPVIHFKNCLSFRGTNWGWALLSEKGDVPTKVRKTPRDLAQTASRQRDTAFCGSHNQTAFRRLILGLIPTGPSSFSSEKLYSPGRLVCYHARPSRLRWAW